MPAVVGAANTAADAAGELVAGAVPLPVVSNMAGWAVAESIKWLVARIDSARRCPQHLRELHTLLRNEQLHIAAHALDQLTDTGDFRQYRPDYDELCTALADAQALLLPHLYEPDDKATDGNASADHQNAALPQQPPAGEVASEPQALPQRQQARRSQWLQRLQRLSPAACFASGSDHNVTAVADAEAAGTVRVGVRSAFTESEEVKTLLAKLQEFCQRERYMALHNALQQCRMARVPPPKPLPVARLPSLQKRCDPNSGGQPWDIEQLPDYVDQQLCSVRNVALVGMGGAGKTTIADQVFERAKHRFNKAVFLTVSSQVSQASLLQLLKQAWVKVVGSDFALQAVDAESGWQALALHCFTYSVKVLLVLDDVWPHDQLAVLAQLNFATDPRQRVAGSRLLVTTRNQEVLSYRPHDEQVQLMGELEVVPVPELRPAQAQALFRQCAFGSGDASLPERVPRDAIEQLAAGCQGNPLAVTVLAGTVRNCCTAAEWRKRVEQAQQLQRSGGDQVAKRMQLSVDLLPPSLQECFVDFAAFPEDAQIPQDDFVHLCATHAPLSSPHIRQAAAVKVQALVDRHLIKEGSLYWYGSVRLCYQMHDVLHTIAQHMAAEPSRKSLFGNSAADCSQKVSPDAVHLGAHQGSALLELPKGTRMRSCCVTGSTQVPVKWLHQAQRLQFLWLRRLHTSEAARALDSLPSVQQLWFVSLAGTDLSHTGALDSLGRLRQLVHLDLSFTNLRDLPESLSNCRRLTALLLRSCVHLRELPQGICSCARLAHLDLSFCNALAALPEGIGGCVQLANLDLSYCRALKALPAGIGSCTRLAHLDLAWDPLAAVPEAISNCVLLTRLDLGYCSGLVGLPESIGGCAQLAHLVLSYCDKLTSLPDGISGCTQLTHLDLYCCEALAALPESIGGCAQLAHLNLGGCGELTALPVGIGGCARLAHLDLGGCGELTALPKGIGGCAQLTRLDLRYCRALAALPEAIGGFTLLRQLELSSCVALSALPHSIAQCTQLTFLDLSGCSNLTETHECLSECTQLAFVGLWGCGLLAAPPLRIGRWGLASVSDLAIVTHLGEPTADMHPSRRKLLTNGLR